MSSATDVGGTDPVSYLKGYEKRHAMSAEARSRGDHIDMPKVTDTGPCGVVPISHGTAPGSPGAGQGGEDYQ